MVYLVGIALIGALLFVPSASLVIYDSGGRQLERASITDGSQVIISHINSIYDARVEEFLELKGGALELVDVKTSSYGVHEYYRTTEGITKNRWTEIILINSSDRNFTIAVDNRRLSSIEENRNMAIRLRIEKGSIGRRFLGSPPGSPAAD